MTDKKTIHVMVAIQPDGEAFIGTGVSATGDRKWREEQAADITGYDDIHPASRFHILTAELTIPPLAETVAASVKEVDDVEF